MITAFYYLYYLSCELGKQLKTKANSGEAFFFLGPSQVKHVQSVMLGRRNYHYLMAGLVLDEQWDSQVIIIIIITRPKPAYGQQGLAGSWGQDTDKVSSFWVSLRSARN